MFVPFTRDDSFSLNTETYYSFKEAGVLDLWFEPIYKIDFKIGDWVKWSGYRPIVSQIYKYNNDNCYTLNIDGTFKTHNSCNKDYLRLATKQEIEKAQKKVYTLGITETIEIVVRDKKAFYLLQHLKLL